jgi:hypothetical protein
MFSRAPDSRVIISAGLFLLLTALAILFADVEPSSVLAGVTPTQESPVETDTPVPPTDTPVRPTDTPMPPTDTPVSPTDTPVWPPTRTPWWPTRTPGWPQYPTATPVYVQPTPVPITEIFMPAPSTGGRPLLGVPTILWEAGLGLVLIGLGLAWRRSR